MDRALREPQPLGEIADADFVMVFGERLDQPQRVRDRGKPGAGLCDARFPLRSGRRLRFPAAYFAETSSFQCLSHFSSSSIRATGSSIRKGKAMSSLFTFRLAGKR